MKKIMDNRRDAFDSEKWKESDDMQFKLVVGRYRRGIICRPLGEQKEGVALDGEKETKFRPQRDQARRARDQAREKGGAGETALREENVHAGERPLVAGKTA